MWLNGALGVHLSQYEWRPASVSHAGPRAERNLIFREQLSRNEQFFKDGQANIERAYVCVVNSSMDCH